MKLPRLIAITGGIGAGKSVVSHILYTMGHPVFDCDSEAKKLMDNDDHIKFLIREKIANDAVNTDGSLNRSKISSIVFSDESKLKTLNEIVHHAVRERLKAWHSAQSYADKCFVETAILYQSGIDRDVDEVWEIIAPLETRIVRVMKRNNFLREEVIARIEAQKFTPKEYHKERKEIVNDDFTPLLPQITNLL